MEPPEDAKNITRGFPPVKREYLGDPDVKYLLPRFPAMSNKDYELSGDGRLTGRFHENMEVWRNREKQQQEGEKTSLEETNITSHMPHAGKENVPFSTITAVVTTARTVASGAAVTPLAAESNYHGITENTSQKEAILTSPKPNTCRELVLYSPAFAAAAALTTKLNHHKGRVKGEFSDISTNEEGEEAHKYDYSTSNCSLPTMITQVGTGLEYYSKKEKSKRLVNYHKSGDNRPGVWEKDGDLGCSEAKSTSSGSYLDSDVEHFDTVAFRKEINKWIESSEDFRSQYGNATEAEEVTNYVLRTYDNKWVSSDEESSESISTQSDTSQNNLHSKESEDDETKEDDYGENDSKEDKLSENGFEKDKSNDHGLEESKLKENDPTTDQFNEIGFNENAPYQNAREINELKENEEEGEEGNNNEAKNNDAEDNEAKDNEAKDNEAKDDDSKDNKASDDQSKNDQGSENVRNGPRYEQLPGSRSGFNSRTGKTNSELEYAMHRLTVSDENSSPVDPDDVPSRRASHYQDLFSSDDDYKAEDEDADGEESDDDDDLEDDESKNAEHDFNSLICCSPPRHERVRDHRGRLW